MKRILFPALVALALTACTTNEALRANKHGQINSIADTTGKDYDLAFVEFGEYGSFQDVTQLDEARSLLQKTPGKVLLVMYVHGWHNHAKSRDVERFSKFLEGIARFQLVQNTGFRVVGVYLGWRGESSWLKGANILTIWDRKRAAERLASNNDCLEAISSLTATARNRPRDDQYVVLLGHSLGGLVLERAVAHSITSALHSREPNARPADLIITLNPASDSILTRQLVGTLQSNFHYEGNFVGDGQYVSVGTPRVTFPGNQQVIVALTAANDAATGRAFPAAMALSAMTKQFNDVTSPVDQSVISERGYYIASPGKKTDLVTHNVTDGVTIADPGQANAIDMNLSRNMRDGRFVTSDTNSPGEARNWREWKLKPTKNARTPYWIIQVPPAIINDHGGIWSDNAQALMAAIFRMNFPIVAKSERGVEKQARPALFQMPLAPITKPATPRN
jgi:pimeloyl-ACP methyl ester carboxylesterase